MRAIVAASIGLACGIFAFTAAMGLAGSWVVAIAAAVATTAGAAWLVHTRARNAFDPAAASRGLKIFSLCATAVVLVSLVRLAVFTVDPSRTEYSFLPTSQWEIKHSCLTAYYVAADASRSRPDVYDHSLYNAPDDDPSAPRKPLTLGPFNIDVYEYPPQFLLLPRAVMLLTPTFEHMRMLWFALCGGLWLYAIWAIARFLGPLDGTRALLWAPLAWSLSTVSALQKGNVQVIVIAVAMLAMLLFQRRRYWLGGFLLAYMTVAKLFPGLLVIYLLARREWRAAAWTTAFSIAFTAVAFAMFGTGAFVAFREHLPGLVGGEAFPAFRNPAAIAVNQSIPGLVFKLKLFGVPGMGFTAAKIVGWLYTLIVVAATIATGRRAWRERDLPLVWLAILILATMRSPFLPQAYGAMPSLWLLTLFAATRPSSRWALVLLALLALNVYWAQGWPGDPRVIAIAHVLPQATAFALVVLTLRLPRLNPVQSTAPR